MKKPKWYNGFAFNKFEEGFDEDWLKTNSAKKEKKKYNKRMKKHRKHFKKHGWDLTETWNLEQTLSCFIVPRLKGFRDNLHGHPDDLTEEGWKKMLNKMIKGFEWYSKEREFDDLPQNEKEFKEAQEGLRFFAERFKDLWD